MKQNVLAMLNGQGVIAWDDDLMLLVLSRMDEVTRLVIDPRSHKKMTRKGNILNYLYWAGHQLENQDSEYLTELVLSHLKNVQKQLQMTFGRMELRALIQSRIPYQQLNPFIKEKISPLLTEEKYSQLQQQPQLSLIQPELEKVCEAIGEDIQNMIYRNILLNAISSLWIEHLTHMEGLRVSIGMEAYAQRDPLVQYKSQASDAFKNLLDNIRMTVIGQMFRTRPSRAKPASTKPASPGIKGESANPAPFQHGKNKFKKHRHH